LPRTGLSACTTLKPLAAFLNLTGSSCKQTEARINL
jgi:hypothetical protein